MRRIVTLSTEDVANAEELIKVLKPLKTMTTLLCSEASSTVSLILPLQNRIKPAVKDSDKEDSNLIKSLKQAIRDDISSRYNDDIQSLLLLTSALDPRFKALPFISEETRLATFTSLITETCKMSEKVNTTLLSVTA